MTTTITVTTHGWPVAVSTSSSHNHSDDRNQSHGYQETTVFVEKGAKVDFHISQGTSISVRELPADAEGLYSKEPGIDAAPAPAAPQSVPLDA